MQRLSDFLGGVLAGAAAVALALLAFGAPVAPSHYKHLRDLPSRDGQSMMVAMVTGERDGQVEFIGCPADSAYGPVVYQVSDPAFAAADLVAGDYVPVFYRWERDQYEKGPGRYHFEGWASRDWADKDGVPLGVSE